jgi:hypothetical protein
VVSYCMATTVLCTLPGLAKLMAQTRGWRSPASTKEHLKGVELHRAVQRHGLSAVLLDYFIFPFLLTTRDWHQREKGNPSQSRHWRRSCGARRSPRDVTGQD